MARGGVRSTSWKKGETRNPRGRPKVVAEVKELARQYTEDALNALVSIVRNVEAPPAARVSAATALLDRGYGKPGQYIEHTGTLTLASIISESMGRHADGESPEHATVQ